MKALLGVIAVVFTLSPTVGIAQTPRQLKGERFAKQAGLFNALSERSGACAAVKDVFPLSERSPV
jgi:hypothetical protein